jgi:mycothiol synthase
VTALLPFDPHRAPESILHGVHEVAVAAEAEDHPEDPPMPFEQRLLRWRASSPSHVEVRRIYAEEGGTVIACAYSQRWPVEDPENSFAWMAVHPRHRRQGLGRLMLDQVLADLEAAGSKKTIVDCVAGRPWEDALARWGLTHALTEKKSRLYLADVDWGLMDSWIDRAQERASDYDILHSEAPIPDRHMEQWCRVNNVMNTAPLEDLELEDRVMTPQKWRELEQMHADRGDRLLATAAVHRASGEFAGFTDVFVQRHQTDLAQQHDTAVDPAHREKGLGRLIKALMIKRIAADHPEVTRIDTGNVGSNAAMLGINIEMGFKPILTINAWQGEIATVRASLASG